MNGNKLQVGIIGAGGMGSRWATVASRSSESHVVSIADPDSVKAESLAEKISRAIRTTKTPEEILRDPNIQAVVIATPHTLLAPLSESALRQGKHVLVEKPGATRPQEIKKAIEHAGKNKLTYMVAFNHRFHPGLWKAHELVAGGEIGRILFIRGRYGHGGRAGYEKEWRASPELGGGGELLDQGVHLIDLARWFLGDLVEAKSMLAKSFWPIQVEDNAFLLLESAKKQIAFLHASWTQWKRIFSWEIVGEKGFVTVEGLGGKYGIETMTLGKRDDQFAVKESQSVFESKEHIDPDDSLYSLWKEFTASIREQRPPVPSAKDAHEALRVIEAAYQENKI